MRTLILFDKKPRYKKYAPLAEKFVQNLEWDFMHFIIHFEII